MSDMIEKPHKEHDTAKEPAKRWVNAFRVRLVCEIDNNQCRPGEMVYGGPFPSKDIAESDAASWLQRKARGGLGFFKVRDAVEYLGAYPEGEQP